MDLALLTNKRKEDNKMETEQKFYHVDVVQLEIGGIEAVRKHY